MFASICFGDFKPFQGDALHASIKQYNEWREPNTLRLEWIGDQLVRGNAIAAPQP